MRHFIRTENAAGMRFKELNHSGVFLFYPGQDSINGKIDCVMMPFTLVTKEKITKKRKEKKTVTISISNFRINQFFFL